MSAFANITDPADLNAIREAIATTVDAAELIPLGIRSLVISPEASLGVVDAVNSLLDRSVERPFRVVVLEDRTRIVRAGRDLKEQMRELLASSFDVKVVILGHDELHADDAALDAATAAVAGADCVVSIGGGTITDIGKVATHRHGGIPLVVIQTAASVDGFTDNVSVILRNGVKRTVPSRWPDVVLADTTTIADAPTQMNSAGFGEVLSLFTAPADWELAHTFGFDDTFRLTPRDFLLEFAGDPASWAIGLADGDPTAVLQLTQMLAIRGIGTGIAGSTACLSGVEHLISHMLDMYAAAHGLVTGLHGAQVGVATQVASAAWELLQNKIATASVAPVFPLPSILEHQVIDAFQICDPSGARGNECWSEYQRKLEGWNLDPSRVERVLGELVANKVAVAAAIPTPSSLSAGLSAAGSPADPTQLGDWVTPESWRWAVANCHLMRDRFTVIDLLFFLGWWNDEEIDAVITRASSISRVSAA